MKQEERAALRNIIANITASQKLAKLVPGEAKDQIDRKLMLEALNDAFLSASAFLAENLVKLPDMGALDGTEEIVYDTLRRHLVRSKDGLSDDQFAQLSDQQRFSAARVLVRQNLGTLQTCGFDGRGDVLFLQFPHIVIGIEPDGYAHS